MSLYRGSFHRSPNQNDSRHEIRVEANRRIVGEDDRPDWEQCCFCGEPATVWPAYGLPPKSGELALVEKQTYPMCGVCFEECEELKGKKGKSYEHHMMLCNGSDRE